MTSSPILIVGGNGKTGGRVHQLLRSQGMPTRPVSRSSSRIFDWQNRATWHNAVDGCRSAYVTYQPDLAVPAAEEDMQVFVEVAQEVGLEHLVLLSGRGEEGAERAEAILQRSGLTWNIVRASWFAQNFSESFMLEGLLSGELVLPANDTVEPFIDVDDIAEVAVACLTRPGLHNQLFEVTGPKAMTFAQCVDEIAVATGSQIAFTPVPMQAYLEVLKAQGVPNDVQWLLNELFTVVFDGRNSQVAHGVAAALGRPPTDFRRYVQKTLNTGVWDALYKKRSV